jgi:type IV pilus assembly protein PilX
MEAQRHRGREHGAVLLVCMVILLLLTLMGLTTMKSALLQERMSGGAADKALAFESAELALRDAERYVEASLTSVSPFVAGCSAGLCLPPADGSALPDTIDWDSSQAGAYGAGTGAQALTGVAQQPRFIIELLPDMSPPLGNSVGAELKGTPFRITVVGYGRQAHTRAVLQTTFYKP